MLAPRRSLASYFDDPGASWHDMTEAPSMDKWFSGPDGGIYFCPDDADPSSYNGPTEDLHEKGKKWKPGQWGFDQAKYDASKAKRMARYEEKKAVSEVVRSEHEKALKLFLDHHGWLPMQEINPYKPQEKHMVVQILEYLDRMLQTMKEYVKEQRERAKATYAITQYDTLEVKAQKARNKNVYVYGLKSRLEMSELPNYLRILSEYAKTAPETFDLIVNYVQDYDTRTNETFSSVLITYLSAIKHEVLSATVHKVKDRKGEPGVEKFLEHSHRAQDELEKLMKKRKYHKIPGWRPDQAPLTALREYIGRRQLARHKKLHPGVAVPEYLKRYVNGWKPPPPPVKYASKAEREAARVQRRKEAKEKKAAKKAANAAKKAAAAASGVPPPPPGKGPGKGRKGKGQQGYMEPRPTTAPKNFVTPLPDDTDQARTYSTRRPIFYQ